MIIFDKTATVGKDAAGLRLFRRLAKLISEKFGVPDNGL
jgi:hypothetical protein